jgi:hypothetical protein
LLLQAALLGTAVILLLSMGLDAGAADLILTIRGQPGEVTLLRILAFTSTLHVLMIVGEMTLTHSTAHARVAMWEMIKGRYKTSFWFGLGLSMLAGLLPTLAIVGVMSTAAGVTSALFALIGVMLYEHAYVQAGQSVPLA